MTTLGVGLFVSTISRTQQQSMRTSTFLFLIPMMYLSGFIFDREHADWIQPIRIDSGRYFIVILRASFSRGLARDVWRRRSRCSRAWPS